MDGRDARGAPRKYFRLTLAERRSIERSLDKAGSESCRAIAKGLGRSSSTIFSEVKNNRAVRRGPGKGQKVAEVPDDACSRLLSWPFVCNGCKRRRYHCTRSWRVEYLASRAQAFSDEERSLSRQGIDTDRESFEQIMHRVSEGLSRGLSPEQVRDAYALDVSVSTIYRWIEQGYADASNLELRRKVKYKPRKKRATTRATFHGQERSYAAFCALPEEERLSACEMDTVMGRVRDSKCLLTLYLRPYRFQLMLLLEEKTPSEVEGRLDWLEEGLGPGDYQRLFDPLLTDNGTEFSDHGALERSALDGSRRRSRLFFCDVRQSQQKGACERNHVELRKVLPKGRGISFDALTDEDARLLMSHVNSEPRPSLGGLSPMRMLKAADAALAEKLFCLLGIREVPIEGLDLTPGLISEAHAGRGDEPLAK